MSFFNKVKESFKQHGPIDDNRPRSNTDPLTCLEVFEKHWQQIVMIMRKYDGHKLSVGQKTSPSNSRSKSGSMVALVGDDIDTILHYFSQMLCLLIEEEEDNGSQGPILRFVLSDDVMGSLLNWCLKSGEFVEKFKFEQLKHFEQLITQAKQQLLVHKPIIRPLMKLLGTCADTENSLIETHLILLLHQLCVSLQQNAQLLELFFDASTDQGPTKFLMFSLLIPYVHREGGIGQQARDALLLIMSLSFKNEGIGKYIANYSDFCPVLAAGLSGLYSSLPRKLVIPADDWYHLTPQDWTHIPELVMFLNSLEFCNAVIQVAHPLVQSKLLTFIYHGFLVPVLGPALHQDISGLPMAVLEKLFVNSMDEVIAATAYLDLFLRRVTENSLIRAFLKFILTEKHDEINILESLITRINSNSRLCMVTLSLFNTMVDMNCEDVMLQLVYRHLIPCTHVMVSQRRAVKDIDYYSKAAEKFLALMPIYCQESKTAELPNTPSGSSSATIVEAGEISTFVPNTSYVTSEARTVKKQGAGKHKHFTLGTFFSQPGARSQGTPTGPNSSMALCGELSIEDYETSYIDYLEEARGQLTACNKACQCWSAPYDGETPCVDSVVSVGSVEPASPVQVAETWRHDTTLKSEALQVLSHGSSVGEPVEMVTGSDTTVPSDTIEQGQALALGDQSESHFKPLVHAVPSDSPQTRPVSEAPTGTKRNEVDDEKRKSTDWNSFLLSLKRMSTPTDECTTLEDSIHEIDEILKDITIPESESDRADSLHEGKHNSTLYVTANNGLNNSIPSESNESALSKDDQNTRDNSCAITMENTAATNTDSNSTAIASRTVDVSDSIEANLSGGSRKVVAVRPKSLGTGSSSYNSLSNPSLNGRVMTPYRARDQGDAPDVGPFLSALLTKLEGMVQNSLYVNLLLTGLIARLACYPQPLLRSYLLNHNLVFQPTVKSLVQVINSLKSKVEAFSRSVDNFEGLLVRAWRYMAWREDTYLTTAESRNRNDSTISLQTSFGHDVLPVPPSVSTNSPVHVPYKEKKRGIISWFRRSEKNKQQHKGPVLQIMAGGGYRYVNVKEQDPAAEQEAHTPQVKNAVYAALVLEEFIKELSAISQEHAVLSDEGYHSN